MAERVVLLSWAVMSTIGWWPQNIKTKGLVWVLKETCYKTTNKNHSSSFFKSLFKNNNISLYTNNINVTLTNNPFLRSKIYTFYYTSSSWYVADRPFVWDSHTYQISTTSNTAYRPIGIGLFQKKKCTRYRPPKWFRISGLPQARVLILMKFKMILPPKALEFQSLPHDSVDQKSEKRAP